MPKKSFYGRSGKGPAMFITDDCDAEKNALKSTWLHSTQLLCIFHYLQSWWRWLWNSERSIENADRQPLVRKLVYTTDEAHLVKQYSDLYFHLCLLYLHTKVPPAHKPP